MLHLCAHLIVHGVREDAELIALQFLRWTCNRRCAFRNCQHLKEPGCAVREGWGRHEWYAELHEEVKAADEVARHRAASKKQREGSIRCFS